MQRCEPQAQRGGPRGWATAQAKSGLGACKKSVGNTGVPLAKTQRCPSAGGKPALWPRWQQTGQSVISAPKFGETTPGSWPASTGTQREPADEQTSTHCTLEAAITTCDTAGKQAMPHTRKTAMKAQR